MQQETKKFIVKNFVIISLLIGIVVLILLSSGSRQPAQNYDSALTNELPANKLNLQNDSGVVINPEKLPIGLTLFE